MASESFSVSDVLKTPPIIKGWTRKQGRKGMIKNWKRRFFVISAGKLSYYSQEVKEFPYGEDLKVFFRINFDVLIQLRYSKGRTQSHEYEARVAR